MHWVLQLISISCVHHLQDYRSSRVILAFLSWLVRKMGQKVIVVVVVAELSRRATYIADSFRVLSLSIHSFHRFGFRAMHSVTVLLNLTHWFLAAIELNSVLPSIVTVNAACSTRSQKSITRSPRLTSSISYLYLGQPMRYFNQKQCYKFTKLKEFSNYLLASISCFELQYRPSNYPGKNNYIFQVIFMSFTEYY